MLGWAGMGLELELLLVLVLELDLLLALMLVLELGAGPWRGVHACTARIAWHDTARHAHTCAMHAWTPVHVQQ